MQKLIPLILTAMLYSQYIHYQGIEQAAPGKTETERISPEVNMILTDSLLDSRKFVFQANAILMTGHTRTTVNPALNFMKVESDSVLIQREYIFEITSRNEMPYSSISGSIENYVVERDKKNYAASLSFDLREQYLIHKVFIKVSVNSDVTVKMDDYTWYGHLSPLADAGIVERRRY